MLSALAYRAVINVINTERGFLLGQVGTMCQALVRGTVMSLWNDWSVLGVVTAARTTVYITALPL